VIAGARSAARSRTFQTGCIAKLEIAEETGEWGQILRYSVVD